MHAVERVHTFAGEKSADKFFTKPCSSLAWFGVSTFVTFAKAGRPFLLLLRVLTVVRDKSSSLSMPADRAKEAASA